MKKVIVSAGIVALGAAGMQNARADLFSSGTADRPWSVSGTLRGFYDDNYNTQQDGPGRIGSWGFEIRPAAGIKYNEGPTSLTASYVYSLKDFTDRPGNKLDQAHEFDFTLNHNFNERYSADIEESFVDSQEPEVLAGTGATVAPLRANGDNYHNSVAINFHAQLTKLFGILLGYSNGWYDYTGGPAGQGNNSAGYGASLNSFTHTWTANANWQIDEETVAVAGYAFSYLDYLSSGSLAPGNFQYVAPATRNNFTHTFDVGVQHNFRSDFGANVHVGIQYADYFNAQNSPGGVNPSPVSPYADLSVNYTYMDGGVFTLGFRHAKNQTDVGFDSATGTLTQDQESSTIYASVVQVLRPISPDLTGSATFSYQDSTFNGGGFDDHTEDYYDLGLNFTYMFTHYLSGQIVYEYDLLQSSIAGRAYDRNQIYLGMTLSY